MGLVYRFSSREALDSDLINNDSSKPDVFLAYMTDTNQWLAINKRSIADETIGSDYLIQEIPPKQDNKGMPVYFVAGDLTDDLIQDIMCENKYYICNKGDDYTFYFRDNKSGGFGSISIIDDDLRSHLQTLATGDRITNRKFFDKLKIVIYFSPYKLDLKDQKMSMHWLAYFLSTSTPDDIESNEMIRALLARVTKDLDYLKDDFFHLLKERDEPFKKTNIIPMLSVDDWSSACLYCLRHQKMVWLQFLFDNCTSNLVEKIVHQTADIHHEMVSDEEGKTVLHHLVVHPGNILAALINNPGFNSALLTKKNNDGLSPLATLSKANLPATTKFRHKYQLYAKMAGVNPPAQINISQARVNNKILNYLEINERDTELFSPGGLCNGYSFLHNIYHNNGLEEHYYLCLVLMSAWDGSKESLDTTLNRDVSIVGSYQTLGDVFEQWTNDIFLTFGSDVNKILPTIEQDRRSVQFSLLKPSKAIGFQQQKSVYNSSDYDGYMPGFQSRDDVSTGYLFKKIAKSKASFRTPAFLGDRSENLIFIYDAEMNVTKLDTAQLANDSPTREGMTELTQCQLECIYNHYQLPLDLHNQQLQKPPIIKEHLKELIKYLSRLPSCAYIDVSKSRHSTTFRPTNRGKICFYDCNDATKPEEIDNHHSLYDKILEKNGDYVQAIEVMYDAGKEIEEGTAHLALELDSFDAHVYYFNSRDTDKQFEHYQLFSEAEYPVTIDQAASFQAESANHFTHLHVAIICHDIHAVNRLLDDGYVDLTAKDIFRLTALETAIKNGFVEAAERILGHIKDPVDIDAFLFGFAFAHGHGHRLQPLLANEKLRFDPVEVCQAAMRFECYALVEDGLKNDLIHANMFIQHALLANDINLIELLVKHGADVNYVDKLGNAAIHYAAVSLNETCLYNLIYNHRVSIWQKNAKGQTIPDLLVVGSIQNDDAEASKKIISLLIHSPEFSKPDKISSSDLSKLLTLCMAVDDIDLFTEVLTLAEHSPDAIDLYVTEQDVRMPLINLALSQGKAAFAEVLEKAGADMTLPVTEVKKGVVFGNPLIGKTANDLKASIKPTVPSSTLPGQFK